MIGILFDWMATTLSAAKPWISTISAGDILLFAAEMFVGWVIYLELEHNRFTNFLEKATEKKSDAERRNIYAMYLSLRGTPEEKTKAFQEMIFAPDEKGQCLKLGCDNQIALFNEMGFSINRWWAFDWLPLKRNKYVALFPHAPVYVWCVIEPYLRHRRAATGPWFARNALIFMKRSVEYVLTYGGELKLNRPDGTEGIRITVRDMEKMKRDLKELIAQKRKPLELP